MAIPYEKKPLPVIENGFRLAHEYQTADATFANIYWLIASDVTDPDTVGHAFIDAYANVTGSFSMKSLHSADVLFVKCAVTPLDGLSPTLDVLYSAGVHGGGATPAAAANAALVMTWETGFRGRSNRGRAYLGGCPNASLETGGARWSSGLVTDALDAFDGFTNGLAGATPGLFQQVVSQHSEVGDHHRQVQYVLPRRKVGTQRRRTER